MSFGTQDQDNAICPHCGSEDRDSWELGGGGEECGETECGECGKAFIWIRHIHVTYSTKKKETR